MIEEFLRYLRYEKNHAELTVKAYGNDLADFESYFKTMDSSIAWNTVDADIVRDWLGSMMDKGNTASSIKRRLSALHSFYHFALSHGLVDSDPTYGITGPKAGKPLPSFVKETAISELLDKEQWGTEFNDVRARTIIELLYETGLRVSELRQMNDDSLSLTAKEIKVTGKGNKQRVVPFGERLAATLEQYMALRDEQVSREDNALFVTIKGKRMNYAQVRSDVRDNLRRVCSQKKLSPHVLRHSFATAMLNNDASLESVRKLLGHESLKTTEIYTHVTFEQMKKQYKVAHPRA